MGKVLANLITKEKDLDILCGIDLNQNITYKASFPIYKEFGDRELNADVVIDFSHHTAIKPMLAWCILHRVPIVIATTGLGPEEHRIIQEAAKQIPIFQSANMSIGVNTLCRILEIASNSLGPSFDVEIFEKHHKHKKDAPSGTAFMLVDAVGHSCPIHSIRSGTIPGEHTVIFAGSDEVLTITHTAYSREIFARGAIAAAKFIVNQTPGLYNMKDLIKE
ncbi:MAG: 4-hydroxy-tetrahydrodipicolinate reductase [Clostridiales bacterium]|nr:4-hydroxy-tetrahydrodipicolinate reductase [Clostridiales bacterium]